MHCAWFTGAEAVPVEFVSFYVIPNFVLFSVTHDVGAVGCLKQVKRAISVARSVMEHTTETFLVGDDGMTFLEVSLSLV